MHQNRDVLMVSISRFYSNEDNMREVVSVVKGSSDISLRMIDWFITNYAKKNVSISVREDEHLNIYNSYRGALKTFSKQQFDPFRRHERILFKYGDSEALETTVGQLNFFKWAIETGVIDYIRQHKVAVERSMIECGAAKPAKKVPTVESSEEEGDDKKPAAPRPAVVRQKCKTTLSFD